MAKKKENNIKWKMISFTLAVCFLWFIMLSFFTINQLEEKIQTFNPLVDLGVEKLCQEKQYEVEETKEECTNECYMDGTFYNIYNDERIRDVGRLVSVPKDCCSNNNTRREWCEEGVWWSGVAVFDGTGRFEERCRLSTKTIYKNFTTGRVIDIDYEKREVTIECWDLRGEKIFNTKKWDKDITFNLNDCDWASNSNIHPDSFIYDNGEDWEIFNREEKSQIFTIEELLGGKKC